MVGQRNPVCRLALCQDLFNLDRESFHYSTQHRDLTALTEDQHLGLMVGVGVAGGDILNTGKAVQLLFKSECQRPILSL